MLCLGALWSYVLVGLELFCASPACFAHVGPGIQTACVPHMYAIMICSGSGIVHGLPACLVSHLG